MVLTSVEQMNRGLCKEKYQDKKMHIARIPDLANGRDHLGLLITNQLNILSLQKLGKDGAKPLRLAYF